MKLTDKLLGIIAKALLIIALQGTRTVRGEDAVMELNERLIAILPEKL